MRHRQGCETSPRVGHGIVHLTGWLVSVIFPQITHPARDIQTSSQGFHAVLSPVMGHICQVHGSSLRVVQEHGNQTHKLTVETSRNKNPSIYGSDAISTQSLVQGPDKAVENEIICGRDYYFDFTERKAKNQTSHRLSSYNIFKQRFSNWGPREVSWGGPQKVLLNS